MKAPRVALLLLLWEAMAATVTARPEPPPPPSYSTTFDHLAAPPPNAVSAAYGPPQQQYNAPSDTYGPPQQQYNAPSSQYGAPSQQSNGRSAARVSSRIGGARRGTMRRAGPSSVYGAPAVTAARFSAPASSYGAPAPVYGPPGYDARARLAQDDLSEPANYEFQYAVEDDFYGTNFGHQEDRQEDSAKGEYRVLLPDGRTQIVEYTADEEGFQPSIRYEEPQGPYPASQRSQAGPY